MNHSQPSCSLWARLLAPLAVCAALAALSGAGLPAHAASESASKATATAAKKKKTSNAVRIKNSRNDSGETTAERDRRLYRECKGLPNAGACRGYTQR